MYSGKEKCERFLKLKLENVHEKIKQSILAHKVIFMLDNEGEPMSFMAFPPVTLPLRKNIPDQLSARYKRNHTLEDQIALTQWVRDSLHSGLIKKIMHARALSPIMFDARVMHDL